MKAVQIQEKLQIIAASNGVKKLAHKEGRRKQVGNVRLTWKATGEDTGYAISFYEMDLSPGKGIPLHSHPYAEVFYVIAGHTDFLRIDEHGQEEWVRCGPGDTLLAPMNALHAFHNRTDKPSRFVSSSGYYHEVFFETYAPTVDANDPLPPKKEPTEAVVVSDGLRRPGRVGAKGTQGARDVRLAPIRNRSPRGLLHDLARFRNGQAF